jgi:hypothetical protein
MSKRKRKPWMGLGPVMFFVAFCIAATILGIWINGNIYLRVNNPDIPRLQVPP